MTATAAATTEKQKTVGIASYETQQLVTRLKRNVVSDIYDVIPYDELTTIIGFDVRKEGRSYLDSARKIVERDTGRLVGIVPKEGIKLLSPDEQVAIGPDAILRMKRATNKSIRRVARVQVDRLTEQQKREYHTTSSVLGALHLFTTPKSVAKIEEAVSKCSDKLAIGDTLKLFGK